MTQDEARAEGRVARSVGRSQSQKAPHYMHDNRGDYESPTSRRIGISNRNRRDGERWVRGVVLGESKAEPEPDVDMGMVEPEEEGVGDERGEEEGVGDEHGEEEEEEHEHEQVGNVENIEAVQKAAALLANLPSLFQGLCEPCFGLLQTRLSEIASGVYSLENSTRKCTLQQSSGEWMKTEESNYIEDPSHTEDTDDHTAIEEVTPTSASKQLSIAERTNLRLLGITRKKDYICLDRVDGKITNIAAGLELHTGVFSKKEQQRLVDMVHDLRAKGRRQELKERTYNEPKKWMRGKGRVTIQFGCCYNYALDKYNNPPGILQEDVVDPLPQLLKNTIKRLVTWHVLPPTCVPDSCIINIYEEGDCIPPHIDHHDFLRPFCTLSLLSECNIVFGANLKIVGPGEFDGKMAIPLPMGSVLVLNGNGADLAKHAIPAVPSERISITFRKMDPSKVPKGFSIDTELQGLRPCVLPSTPSI